MQNPTHLLSQDREKLRSLIVEYVLVNWDKEPLTPKTIRYALLEKCPRSVRYASKERQENLFRTNLDALVRLQLLEEVSGEPRTFKPGPKRQ